MSIDDLELEGEVREDLGAAIGQCTHAFAGYCTGCGVLVAFALAYPASLLSDWLRGVIADGRRLAYVPVDEAMRDAGRCTCGKPE